MGGRGSGVKCNEPGRAYVTTVKVPYDTGRALVRHADAMGVSVTMLVRDWIEANLPPSSRRTRADARQLELPFL